MNTSEVAWIVIGSNVPVAFGWDLIRRRLAQPGKVTAARSPEDRVPLADIMAPPPHEPVTPLAPVPPADRPAIRPDDGTGIAAVFGTRIRELRNGRGLSTRALAALAGVSSSTVSCAENGKPIMLPHAVRLCAAFGVSVDAMVAGEQQEAAS